jgi:hypothetical protein
MVYGDLSPDDGEEASDGLTAILGEKFEPPVVMDVARLRSTQLDAARMLTLRARLAASLDADAVNKAVDRLGPDSTELYAIVGDLLGGLCAQPSARVRHELEHVVATCRDPRQLHPGTQQLLRSLLDAIGSAIVHGEIRHRVEPCLATAGGAVRAMTSRWPHPRTTRPSARRINAISAISGPADRSQHRADPRRPAQAPGRARALGRGRAPRDPARRAPAAT